MHDLLPRAPAWRSDNERLRSDLRPDRAHGLRIGRVATGRSCEPRSASPSIWRPGVSIGRWSTLDPVSRAYEPARRRKLDPGLGELAMDAHVNGMLDVHMPRQIRRQHVVDRLEIQRASAVIGQMASFEARVLLGLHDVADE